MKKDIYHLEKEGNLLIFKIITGKYLDLYMFTN